MKLIPLTKGLFAQVDDDLYEELRKYNWYASGLTGQEYAARRTRAAEDPSRKLVYMHQQVLGLHRRFYKGLTIDHEDNHRLNNQRKNLVVKTPLDNNINCDRVRNATGVSYDTTYGKYKAYIGSGAARINVGTYNSFTEAAEARAVKLTELTKGPDQ